MDEPCEQCGRQMTQPDVGRPRHYCSGRCRQRAYRARQRPEMTDQREG